VVSLFPDRDELREELALSHVRKMVAGTASIILHLLLLLLAAFLVYRRVESVSANENVVFVNNSFPMDLPSEGDGREGGVGGGGGKEEKLPASGGRMPATTPIQFLFCFNRREPGANSAFDSGDSGLLAFVF
jgi:hypothetical protein